MGTSVSLYFRKQRVSLSGDHAIDDCVENSSWYTQSGMPFIMEFFFPSSVTFISTQKSSFFRWMLPSSAAKATIRPLGENCGACWRSKRSERGLSMRERIS